jgi:hypothetical protein
MRVKIFEHTQFVLPSSLTAGMKSSIEMQEPEEKYILKKLVDQ